MRLAFLLITLLAGPGITQAQKNEYVREYINAYKQLAVEEMIRTGVPATIKLAQGIHETEAGRSDLVTRSNNHFGIKCKTGWQGDKVFHDDDARGECFRSYASSADSYRDHSDFLKGSPRYGALFQLDPTDYKAWAYGLRKAGYATNIKYAQILIKIIEEYNLQIFSLVALGKASPEEELLAGIQLPGGPDFRNAALASSVEHTREQVVQAPLPPTKNYPAGEFQINRTRVVFARAGTSLLELANQFELNLSRLLEFNDLEEEEVLVADQLIFLQRKRKTGTAEYHVVAAGESLYQICQEEGIRLESLLQLNLLEKNHEPAVGERLSLQKTAAQAPKLAESERPPALPFQVQAGKQLETEPAIRHRVAPKETLYAIARNYNITVDQLKAWNKLTQDHLREGQELVIYKN